MSHNGSNNAPGRSHGAWTNQISRTLANKKRRLTREIACNPKNVSAAGALLNLRYKKPQSAWTKEPGKARTKSAAT